jgi:hypothetical protein
MGASTDHRTQTLRKTIMLFLKSPQAPEEMGLLSHIRDSGLTGADSHLRAVILLPERTVAIESRHGHEADYAVAIRLARHMLRERVPMVEQWQSEINQNA